jgi:hypothetical protein
MRTEISIRKYKTRKQVTEVILYWIIKRNNRKFQALFVWTSTKVNKKLKPKHCTVIKRYFISMYLPCLSVHLIEQPAVSKTPSERMFYHLYPRLVFVSDKISFMLIFQLSRIPWLISLTSAHYSQWQQRMYMNNTCLLSFESFYPFTNFPLPHMVMVFTTSVFHRFH